MTPRSRMLRLLTASCSALLLAGVVSACSQLARRLPGDAARSTTHSTTTRGTTPAATTTSVLSGPVTPTSASAPPPTEPASPPATPRRCGKALAAPLTQAPVAQNGATKTVALTFDDGPGGVGREVGEVLRRYGVRATFFQTGAHQMADAAGETAWLAAQGHAIENHSYSHQYPGAVRGGWSRTYLGGQLTRTNALIRGAAPDASLCWFRPPGGFLSNVVGSAHAQGMNVAMWSVDSLDWQQPATVTPVATRAIVKASTTVPKGVTRPIVLMHVAKASHEPEQRVHAFRGNTLAALPAIIEWYQKRGYTFVDLQGGVGLTSDG